MDDGRRRKILEDVAAGRVSPEAGARLLEEPEEPVVPPPATLRRVRVFSPYGTVKVVGDRAVAEARVEGPHRLERHGDTLLVHCEPVGQDLVEELRAGSFRLVTRAYAGIASRLRPMVQVRMRPDLALELEASAGTVTVSGVSGPVTCDVTAGSARLEGVRGPLECRVHAGALAVEATLAEGRSTISCEAGTVRVRLSRDSDVRVRVASNLSRADVRDLAGAGGEYVLGGGRATLEVSANLGTVLVDAA